MLAITWFILWGVLWAVYFMLDGFDLGLGSMLPVLAKNEKERRMIYNSMGPFWDGNEVWLITAGGATFAAFPKTYAVMFSSMYSALMLILFALILRGVSFEFRNKMEGEGWKKVWDAFMIIGSFAPALLFGIAFANIFKGIPIDAQGHYQGTLLTLLNPYGVLGGILFLLLFFVHGSLWLTIKTSGDISRRAANTAKWLWPFAIAAAAAFLIMSAVSTNLWNNYLDTPVLLVIPALAVTGMVTSRLYMEKSAWIAWAGSSFSIVFCTFFGIAGLYPDMFPSSIDPAYSLTLFNSSSSDLTLKIMLGVVLVFVPIVITYQTIVYKTFSFKLTDKDLESEQSY